MQDVRAQVGPTSKMLSGDERTKADRWQARFSDGANHLIDIVLIHEGTATIESLQQDCSVSLASKLDDVCAAAKTSSGIPYQYIERAAYQMDESWPTPNDTSLPEPVPADERWYLHQVKVFNPDGLTVVATEVVHSAASTTAANQWTLTQDHLMQIASDPLLTFPRWLRTPGDSPTRPRERRAAMAIRKLHLLWSVVVGVLVGALLGLVAPPAFASTHYSLWKDFNSGSIPYHNRSAIITPRRARTSAALPSVVQTDRFPRLGRWVRGRGSSSLAAGLFVQIRTCNT